MSEAERDVTDLATVAGWALPVDEDGNARVRVVATLRPDEDCDPREDGDWATPADVDAWVSGDWQYWVVRVAVRFEGIELGSASLGAVVGGTLPETDHAPSRECDPLTDDEQLRDLVAEALPEASEFLRGLQGIAVKSPEQRRAEPWCFHDGFARTWDLNASRCECGVVFVEGVNGVEHRPVVDGNAGCSCGEADRGAPGHEGH